ncbi:hypothetical protein NP493_403g07034 [Ridgeia piscesae]|uniref:Kinesin-like protein n=1 Tax=Ridgeia piscesae TaxID=27915 RepID=A0AAD9L153_RIDPI|nr:hypothetical protein NP493_403g07034 [Ridgeia piscesae]
MEPDSKSSPYASQQKVFDELGKGVLDNAFQGYNCSLFAYGQTGSGKSYSMVGYGVNKGIVPVICDVLFQTIETNKDSEKRFEVTFSMLEIYNEQVRDLLSKNNPKGGLPIRQNPKLGIFYVQDLKKVPVGSYKEIEQRIEQGTAARTVASTNMNATSSRAHTVVTLTFDQIYKVEGEEKKKSSVMNLVDLAGSERADSTGATGDRLKEGANINKSLSALGNVISALADLSMGKKKVLVPYRDSALTKLLQNALGGNSKTVMIAALSPADINYDETLSTLRYADRAKKIKNKAVVNENPMDKLIRELKEENEKLKQAMMAGGVQMQTTSGMSPEEVEKMKKDLEEEIRAQLLANQEMLAGAEGTGMSWEEKLAVARSDESVVAGSEGRKKTELHLMNLNEDPLLSGVVVHFLQKGDTTVGRKDADPVPSVCLSGLSINKHHAILTVSDKGEAELKPADQGAKTKLNGLPLTGPTVLSHKDRILFGSNHMYVFLNPKNVKSAEASLPSEITWEFAQKEIAQAKGFAVGSSGMTKDQQIAQEEVLEILPLITEVNAVSEELDKHRTFEVVLISAAAQEGGLNSTTGTKVMVKMKDLLTKNTWLWERAKFMNRRYIMQDMYERWLDGEDISKIPKEEDPFWEPTEDVLIGTANVFLQSLAYALDFDDRVAVADYKGQEEGYIVINVAPTTQKGKLLDEDFFVDDPTELLNKPFHFKVSIRSAEIFKARFSLGLHIKYRVYKDQEYTQTKMIKGTLTPEFNHSKVFSFPSIEQEHLDFFESGCITFLVYGVQEDKMADSKLSKMTTRELRQMEKLTSPSAALVEKSKKYPSEGCDHIRSELILMQKKYKRLEQKERRMQDLCREWDNKPPEEKQFDPFYRVVSAVANSSGTKFKTRVMMVNRMLTAKNLTKNGGPTGKGQVTSKGTEKDGSSACSIQ